MKKILLFALIYSVYGHNVRDNIIITKYDVEDQSLRVNRRYKPDWKDLDARPLPEWYDRAKVGIFLHWGVYSVPGFFDEWFWLHYEQGTKEVKDFMTNNYPPGFTYQQFAPSFKAEFFNPEQWADLFKKSGARYVVLTSKHHEGFTLFPSKHSFSWNAVDIGPRRDLVKDLSEAVREKGIEFGVYHSLFEWFNPMYLNDKAANYSTNEFVQNKVRPDIEQLVNDYQPSVIWSDGDWEASDEYWNSTHILAWLYNDSPVKNKIVVNDRWGKGTAGKHGDFFNVADRYNPGVLLKHKWESAFTVDKESWGFRRNLQISDILTSSKLIENVVIAISCGGNALINVGPTKEGTIAPIFEERLLTLGKWLSINGEAIYDSSPWLHQNDTYNNRVWYTCNKTRYDAMYPTAVPLENEDVNAIYAITLSWPENNILKIGGVTAILKSGSYNVEMLGQGSTPLKWTIEDEEFAKIILPNKATVRSEHAWTLKITKHK